MQNLRPREVRFVRFVRDGRELTSDVELRLVLHTMRPADWNAPVLDVQYIP